MKKPKSFLWKKLIVGGLMALMPLSVSQSQQIYKKGDKVEAPIRKWKVGLDPGHGFGNKYPGRMDWGDAKYYTKDSTYKEADMVLCYSKNVESFLNPNEFEVIQTRKDNKTALPVKERPIFANEKNLDLFASIHVNKMNPWRYRGFEVIYRDQRSKPFAMMIAKTLEKEGIPRFRVRRGDFWVLEDIKCPSVIVETGNILSRSDRKYLLDSIPDVERGISRGIEQYRDSVENLVPRKLTLESITWPENK